ncbi:MAG: hypothetical protein EP298_09170 [Gammaproteobacteria bacterium]|nr:MAG: hypothetical protein EP298_09170 [Gammaproteobacteria bacterium]UTW42348.1 hypothetical protein KFE69_12815 [bacterium SCSIO 12844]
METVNDVELYLDEITDEELSDAVNRSQGEDEINYALNRLLAYAKSHRSFERVDSIQTLLTQINNRQDKTLDEYNQIVTNAIDIGLSLYDSNQSSNKEQIFHSIFSHFKNAQFYLGLTDKMQQPDKLFLEQEIESYQSNSVIFEN